MEHQETVLLVGMAKSGISAAKMLNRLGKRVIINDMKTEIPGLFEALAGCSYENRLGEAPETLVGLADLVVISPIIPMTKPWIKDAQRRGIPVISEIELGYRYAKAEFVCITGTNGKTTCTALTGEMFKKERNTFVLGNIGIPITEHALDTKAGDVIVAETAALQLEGDDRFHARAAGVCNITEDHLDHFGTMDAYIAAKCRIFEHQTERDFAVLNYDDPEVRAMYALTPAKVLYFSRLCEVENGMFLAPSGILIYRTDGVDVPLLHKDEIRIPGAHNLENAMLSSLLALAMGVSKESVVAALREFPGVEHRIEFVRELDGVVYINDSKGTNPASTIRAIEAMTRPTVLILGGYDKHADFHALFERFGSRVRAVVVLGQTAEQILETAREKEYLPICQRADSFIEAVRFAREMANPGDAVLLSPACASWGMFENFEQRGRVFKEIVNGYHSKIE